MASSISNETLSAQAVVAGDLSEGATLSGRAGPSEFALGGPAEYGGNTFGPNPYDLLSASLAACTAMTMRLHAKHKRYLLSHVEVAVTYHHGLGGSRGSFERAIIMDGDLDENQRAELLRGAIACPVAKTLEAGADIDTRLAGQRPRSVGPTADYFEDLFSIVNIDPD